VPDVEIPAGTLAALERAGAAAPLVGVELAVELAGSLRGMTSGLVVAPVVDVADVVDVVGTARRIMAAWR
jgi:homocysteine S-methyltransferase